jgi:hypothetical protein
MKPDEEKQNYWQESTPEPAAQQPDIEWVEPETLEQQIRKPESPETPVSWSAHEYVHIDKSPIWFVLFVIVVLGLIAVDVFLLKSWTFSALVIVMAIAVIIYARRPPRELTYTLSAKQGLYISERLYHFDEFKSFGIIKDGEHNSIMLIPTKRFSPGVSVYFPEEAGERIVDILGQRLPMEELKLDIIDIVVRKLRL